MRYLITCSGSKNCPESSSNSLDNLSFPELYEKRKKIIEISGINLDWNRTMPAWKLYSGNYSKLYPQISETNWRKSNTEVIILSALFGFIKHTDRIPTYNLQMKSRIGIENKLVRNVWNDFNILESLIYKTDIDLLSLEYRKAISRNGIINLFRPNVIFTDRGVQKGRWLNRELSKG